MAHSPAFTALVLYERQDGPGFPVAAPGAAQAGRFRVAIAGPPWGRPGTVERYTLRGTLNEVRDKLAAALGRRQHAYNTRPQEADDGERA